MAHTDDEYEHAEIEIHGAQGIVTSTHPHEQHPATRPTSGNVGGKKPKNSNSFQTHSKISVIPENRKGELNMGYLATLPGVLKLAEIILGFISFILAICADRRSTSAAWTEHISFETTIVVSALLVGYIIFPHLTIGVEKTRQGLVVLELIFYGINTLFYFIGIWLMVHLSASWTAEGRGAAIMDSILCVALCALYAVETFTKLKTWRDGESPLNKKSPKTHPTTNFPTNTNQSISSQESTHELHRDHSVV